MARKSYNEKLNTPGDLPKVVDISNKATYVNRYGGDKMLIAAPMQYSAIMESVPMGKLITSDRLRDYLARNADADVTCPLTAGIFINVCAYAAIERLDLDFPWWRTLKSKGELNDRFPGGCEAQRKYLETEGFKVIQKGKKYFVEDYENFMLALK